MITRLNLDKAFLIACCNVEHRNRIEGAFLVLNQFMGKSDT